MFILEALRNIITSVLIAYLALTNSLAYRIESFFGYADVPQQEEQNGTIDSSAVTQESSSPSKEILRLSQSLATHTSIPDILRKNADFQEAAIGLSGFLGEGATTTLPLKEAISHALVNIFCQYKTKEYIRTTTGTGFFINANGVILTNAHVAQFLLLEEVDDSVLNAECVIRAGNPATPEYFAELLYISPSWVLANANLITEETPRGTGESDYALLYVSKTIDGAALPTSFPTLKTYTSFLTRNTTGAHVISAGYPAEKLYREGANAKLIPAIASTTIGELYTFGSNYADIFSISASNVGEQGSSGGPVVDPGKGVLGLIVTKGEEATEGSKSLRALTLSYIDRTITDETGYSLAQNTQGDLVYRGKVFKKALIPFLSHLLEVELTK